MHPARTVQALVIESLRYWVTSLGVDGFRFDLAVTLGRDDDGFDPHHPLLAAITDDPVLAGTKLIAEPWDIGPGGYRVGGFPAPFAEWNGVYRDAVRDVWRGRGTTGDLARAIAGSSETFPPERGPLAGVSFVTAHDGFTLHDLVSYDAKHNEANGEGNRDGDDHNRSWNSGAEGPTDDASILEVRRRRAAGLLATLFTSQGVPMLLAGDERGRTQRGNNNAYCHDTPRTWVDWDETWLGELVPRLIALRASHSELRRTTFLEGDHGDGSPVDVRWLGPDGRELGECVAAARGADAGRALRRRRRTGRDAARRVPPRRAKPGRLVLPPGRFTILLDSADPGRTGPVGDAIELDPWSVVILRDEA